MNKTILIASLLAATLLAAGWVILPDSVQEVQANPCAENTGEATVDLGSYDADLNCDFKGIGSLIIRAHSNENDVPLGELPLPTQ
jgi:hypothetical protein